MENNKVFAGRQSLEPPRIATTGTPSMIAAGLEGIGIDNGLRNGRNDAGKWSRRRESNPHRAKLRQILSLLRLPVPPLRACNENSTRRGGTQDFHRTRYGREAHRGIGLAVFDGGRVDSRSRTVGMRKVTKLLFTGEGL